MAAIYKKELQGFFTSMIGYVVLAFMLFFASVYFIFVNLYSGFPLFGYSLSSISFIFMIAIPILTMRSLAEERRNKTDQMLFTAPVSLWKIILGKYLAMVTVMAVICLAVCTCPLVIRSFGGIYTLSDYSCILAFFLYGCAAIAIGLFLSSLTESQIIAAVSTFGVLLILHLMPGLTQIFPGNRWGNAVAEFLNSLSLTSRFDNFVVQIFDVPAIIFYLSISALFVFLTVQSVERRRWS